MLVLEHALTHRHELTDEEINYLALKANRLGLSDRRLIRVFSDKDTEGTHIIFEVEELKQHKI